MGEWWKGVSGIRGNLNLTATLIHAQSHTTRETLVRGEFERLITSISVMVYLRGENSHLQTSIAPHLEKFHN